MEKAQLENSLKDMQEQLEHAKKVGYNCLLYMSAVKRIHVWIQRGGGGVKTKYMYTVETMSRFDGQTKSHKRGILNM